MALIKKLPSCNRTRVNNYRLIPPLTHTNIRVPFNGGKPASLTFIHFRQQLQSDFLLSLLVSGFHHPRLAVSFNNKILSPSSFLSCFIINRRSGKCQGGIPRGTVFSGFFYVPSGTQIQKTPSPMVTCKINCFVIGYIHILIRIILYADCYIK